MVNGFGFLIRKNSLAKSLIFFIIIKGLVLNFESGTERKFFCLEKILSIVVPCYNSADYLERCVNSLLLGGDEVEIILVDDGSTDQTPEQADYYQREFADKVSTIHQVNGGHGAAINSGLAVATGKFFKVVDSDDWLDAAAYHQMLKFLKSSSQKNELPDLMISNFIYDKIGVQHKKAMEYTSFLPQKQLFGWDEVKFPVGKYLIMHSLIYRTQLLKEEAHLRLPAHMFYEDNLYAFEPLPFVKKLCYLDLDLYHYFIGREDQSVNEKVMLKRIDQQLWINREMVKYYLEEVDSQQQVSNYMKRYLEIITTISSILLIKDGTSQSLRKKDELWEYIADQDLELYHQLRRSLLGIGVNLPGKLGRKTAVGAYQIARKMYGFN